MEWRRTSPYVISFLQPKNPAAASISLLCACKEEGAVMSIQNE